MLATGEVEAVRQGEQRKAEAQVKWELFRETILLNKYILHKPYITADGRSPQTDFITCTADEALFGGAAGPGKTEALLMCALQFVNLPEYNAVIFRKTLHDPKRPEGLMQSTLEWLGNSDAKWNGQDFKGTFPSGATLTLGYMDNDQDGYHHQSAAYQFIGWDELTQFEEWQYKYLISRLRRSATSYIPLRIRAATIPEPTW